MATLSNTGITVAGGTYSLTAAGVSGDTIPAGDHAFLAVANGSGSSITVTITSVQTCSQGGTHNLVVTVGAGATKLIGPLPSSRFSDPVAVSYSATTSVTVGGFTL